MNDFETALRNAFKAQAVAAERPVELLGGVHRRARRLKLRRRVVTAALSTVVAAVVSIVPLSLYALSHFAIEGAASGPMATQRSAFPWPKKVLVPPGWSPVSYGGIQISVPRWWVIEDGPGCPRHPRGVVFAGVIAKEACLNIPNAIVISRDPQGQTAGATTEINGIQVQRSKAGATTTYVLPTFGLEIRATGPKTGRVMATLTRSPASVALEQGPLTRPPPTWRRYRFGGIEFAAPANWRTVRTDVVMPASWCLNGVPKRQAELDTARTVMAPSCPPVPSLAGIDPPYEGVLVVAGTQTPEMPAPGLSCRTARALRICVENQSPLAVALKVWVLPPAGGKPVLVEIGLSGTGKTDRRIFDSIELPSGL